MAATFENFRSHRRLELCTITAFLTYSKSPIIAGKTAPTITEFSNRASKAYAELSQKEKECLSESSETIQKLTKKEIHRRGSKIFRKIQQLVSEPIYDNFLLLIILLSL